MVSNSLVICFVSGCALFDSVALAAACVISWINVCALIPVSSSSVIVFVSGSNIPAAGRPSAAFRSFLVTSFVSPITSASFRATLRTCLLGEVSAKEDNAAFRSPALIDAPTDGCKGRSKPTTALASSSFLIFMLVKLSCFSASKSLAASASSIASASSRCACRASFSRCI